MDRYVIREPREEYPQGNQMIAFSPNAGSNNMVPTEGIYYSGYGAEFPMHRVGSAGFMGVTHVNSQAPQFRPNLIPGQGQVTSGIDPRYLSTYADNNAAFISDQHRQQMQRDQNQMHNTSTFGQNYQNHNFGGAERNNSRMFAQQVSGGSKSTPRNETLPKANIMHENLNAKTQQKAVMAPQPTPLPSMPLPQPKVTNVPPKQAVAEVNILKNEFENPAKARFDKLKALYKSGPRVFSGPVEMILKWHKALQDIGVLVLYEIVAKCVNVRPGESCAKNLVVRDDNGPAIQVVYYEIDFLLTDLKPPCTVRVIGRMMPGTCRLQAFNVRLATGDDVATLPRRAAIAAHHVAKLCKEYGTNI